MKVEFLAPAEHEFRKGIRYYAAFAPGLGHEFVIEVERACFLLGEHNALKRGETFYESPQDVHRQSANASTTEPAKILVLMVKDQGKAASRAVAAAGAR